MSLRFDAIKFLDDYRIPYRQDRRGERQGWVHIECPFCTGQSRFTGGFNIGTQFRGDYRCWRCDWIKLDKVIASLLRIPTEQAWRIARQYRTAAGFPDSSFPQPLVPAAKELKWPMGLGPMGPKHRAYLESRGYDPDLLERIWGLKGTDRMDPEYRWRIVAPITHKGQVVSYQARDITGSHPLRYRACAQADELIHHKHALYGLDNALALRKGRCVVVEGITGVWRLGPGAVATFGTGWTPQQLYLLAYEFSRIFIFFDPVAKKADQNVGAWDGSSTVKEEPASFAADRLVDGLRAMGVEVEKIWEDTASDPGEMSDADAMALMKELKLR